jgi:hypothetical protein
MAVPAVACCLADRHFSMTIEFPLRTESLNKKEHYHVKAKRVKNERTVVAWELVRQMKTKPELPCVVTFTRLAPRLLDEHDNLPGSFKHVVDALCKHIGIDDGSEKISFKYKQEKSSTYHIRIDIA